MPAPTENLAPHVREIDLIGATSSGKSLFASYLAKPAAQKILSRCVGETNSTIINRLLVFTTDEKQVGKLTVAVKRNSTAFPPSNFQEILVSAVARVIQKFKGANLEQDQDTAVEGMREALEKELVKGNNLRAVLSLLTEKERHAFIEDLAGWYKDVQLWEAHSNIYHSAKNQLDQKSAKNSSALLKKIKTAVREWLDRCVQNQKDALENIYTATNEKLSQRFFAVFNKHCRSADGYYYHELDLQAPDEAFCQQFFTANNLRGTEALSFEVLCSEIVLYIPMSDSIADMIRRNSEAAQIFSDPRGNLLFGLRDTQGLFHADRSDDDNAEYCSELVYKSIADAILIASPLWGDTNGKKSQELYRQTLQGYQKDTPIFLIHNKLDLLVDVIIENNSQFDPLTGQSAGTATEGLTLQEIDEAIRNRVEELERDFRAIQRKNGKKLNIFTTCCFLKGLNSALSPDVQVGLTQKYSLARSYECIFTNLGQSLKLNADKLTFEIDPNEEQIPLVDVAKLRSCLHAHLISPGTDKLVFSPGEQNLQDHNGITPHGNSYHALGRRLRNGDGFKSEISESYYYNCKNIEITFPANIKNLLAPQFLHGVIHQSLTLEGGTFANASDREKFLEKVEKQLLSDRFKNEWIRKLLYDGAFTKASNSMSFFSFQQQFAAFLDYCQPLLTSTKLNEDAYAMVLTALIEEAANVVMNLNVKFC